LSDRQRAAVEEVCRSAVAESVAMGEAIQFEALGELRNMGVTIHRWPPAVLAAMNAAWSEVVGELSADADFKRVWDSYVTFRDQYATWRELGYMR